MANGQPPQNPQEPIVFAEVHVFLDDEDFTHPYARHMVNMGPGGGVLLVQETKENRALCIYPLERLKRVVLTPTRLAAV